jgi:hypothetical protein
LGVFDEEEERAAVDVQAARRKAWARIARRIAIAVFCVAFGVAFLYVALIFYWMFFTRHGD